MTSTQPLNHHLKTRTSSGTQAPTLRSHRSGYRGSRIMGRVKTLQELPELLKKHAAQMWMRSAVWKCNARIPRSNQQHTPALTQGRANPESSLCSLAGPTPPLGCFARPSSVVSAMQGRRPSS